MTSIFPARRASTHPGEAHKAPDVIKDKTMVHHAHDDDANATTPPPAPHAPLKVGDLYWRQDGTFGWALGQVTGQDIAAQTARFLPIDETTGEAIPEVECISVDLTETPLYAANPLFATAADMTSLHHLHEAALAKNLEDRSSLQNLRPYTFMANVLIAVNPLKRLEEPDKSLFIAQSLDRCPPHPYYIAENAYRQLCAVRATMQNQSIIISGESGSGKTETSKIILDFLTTRAVRTSRAPSLASEEDMDPEITPRVTAPPMSAAAALSLPQSSSGSKLSPVTLGTRLMETIPILESFGNAKTHRNHNSSRFGKYMRLQFSSNGHELTGASIDTYLLEKSRLVSQPQGERNFHVFYELLNTEDTEYLTTRLHLKPKSPESYSYLNQSGCMKVETIPDHENFKNLCKALEFVGIMDVAQDEIFKVVGGLLHMGNITISEEDTSEGKTACVSLPDAVEALQHSAELLGVPQEELSECILMKRIVTTRGSRRGSIYYAKKDARTAVYSRDTIAKTIYEHVFTWLMVQCACALDYDAARSDVIPYIGVLDIFGFEDFEPKNRNSFEQLLINYANEALQSLFNDCVFEAEQELYRSENIYSPVNHSLSFPYPLPGVPFIPKEREEEVMATPGDGSVVTYSDNRECLNLIASRHGGVFVTIDNVSRLPGPSDRKLNERLHTLFKRHPNFPTPHPKDIRDTFIIKHYAGVVRYTIDSFVDKNNNIISDQFEELIKRSTSRILQAIVGRNRAQSQTSFSTPAAKTNGTTAFGGAAKARSNKGGSQSSLFSTQMKGLITELEGTSCNFVRCIKPNTLMKPGLFDKAYVVEQLRCSGTVQACEVLRVGLPTRILYAEVVDVYKSLLPIDMFQKFEFNDKLFTQAILWSYDFPTSAYRLGDTRLFFRTGKIDLLDRLLSPSSNAEDCATLANNMYLYMRKKRWIQVATKMIAYNQFKEIYYTCKYRRKAITIQCMVRQHLARKRVARLRVLHRISKLWNGIVHRAEIVHSFEDRPEDKMMLLDGLLSRKHLPNGQKWLLKWLGPLQRVIYLQKLWKKITSQYLAKRAVLSLYESVKKKRSAIRVQCLVRCIIAKKKFLALKRRRLARHRWHVAYLKVRTFCIFRQELHRIHVMRLEKDNSLLAEKVSIAEEKLRQALLEAEELRVKYEAMQVTVDQKSMHISEQELRIDTLEKDLECAQEELVGMRDRMKGGLVERVIRFFTCSTTPSWTPRASLTNYPHDFSKVKEKQQSNTKLKGLFKIPMAASEARILSSDTVLQPLKLQKQPDPVEAEDEENLSPIWCEGFDGTHDVTFEDESLKVREGEALYSVSRFIF